MREQLKQALARIGRDPLRATYRLLAAAAVIVALVLAYRRVVSAFLNR